MAKKIFTGVAAMIIAGALLFFGWLILGTGSAYYTKIDNSRLEQAETEQGVINLGGSGGLACSYTLPAYDKNGREKELTFGASRELREGAYICLTVMPVRGVLEWCEVQYEELPEAVQKHYTAPTDTPG